MNKYDNFLLEVFERRHVMCKTFERSFSSVDEVTIHIQNVMGKESKCANEKLCHFFWEKSFCHKIDISLVFGIVNVKPR